MGLAASPFLLLLVLSSSSCASVFIQGKAREAEGNPRKVEHGMIRGARLEHSGSQQHSLTRSSAPASQLWVTGESRQQGVDVKHALNMAGRRGAVGAGLLFSSSLRDGARAARAAVTSSACSLLPRPAEWGTWSTPKSPWKAIGEQRALCCLGVLASAVGTSVGMAGRSTVPMSPCPWDPALVGQKAGVGGGEPKRMLNPQTQQHME